MELKRRKIAVNKVYELSKKECFTNIFIITAVAFIAAKVFYGSFKMGVILFPFCIPIIKIQKKKLYEKKKQKLEMQFKDMLISMADAMSIGYSVENAIEESYRYLLPMYGKDSDICIELRLMISRIKLNVNAEMAIEDFANRTNLDNIRLFFQIFSVAKRTGGNMTYVIKSVSNNIALKQAVKEEISVATSAKRFEQKIMTIIPIFLMLYVSVASPGFLDVMYNTCMGRIVMTICLILYLIAFLWSEKITMIKI